MNNTRPIKLFVDAHVFDGPYQGTRTFIKGIYSLMGSRPGIEIYLAACDIDNLKRSFAFAPNLKFIKYKSRSRYTRLLFEIPLLIKKHGFDYAHFQYITPLVKNCRFIVTVHDVIFNEIPGAFSRPYRHIKTFLYKRSAQHADILTTVSDFSKASIEKHLKIVKENIHLVPNGIDGSFFAVDDKKAAKERTKQKFGIEKFILYVSRIEPRKNHIVLLDAWLELELYKKNIHLVFLGSQSLKTPTLNKKIDRLPEETRKFIFISETVNDKELLDFYRAATLFVYPSGGEGFGIPPLEAAALEIPVVCSNHAALADYHFFDKDHINPFDLGMLKKRIMQGLESPVADAVLQERSRFVRKLYNWEIPCESLYSILSDHKLKEEA
jgi:glycosyltransferase involved in cell wall biosynthesis